MNNRVILVTVLIFATAVSLFAQQKPSTAREQNPVLHEVSNKDLVQSVFPDAVKVNKLNEFWYAIVNGNKQTIGYAMNSTPFCSNVYGYNSTTPVMIITDKTLIIKKVAMLTNWETGSYVRRLEKKGFFELWTGKTVNEAQTVKVDAHAGATFTAMAIGKNVDYLLTKGVKKSPKIKK